MGCRSSKLESVEDSIHVLLSHEKKKILQNKQQGNTAYQPRKEHPKLLQAQEQDDDLENLMAHAAHHNDSVDPRDLVEYGDAVVEQPSKEQQ